MANLIWVIIALAFNTLQAHTCNCEIPGLPHFSPEQKSILADERVLQNVGRTRIIFVPVCGACYKGPYPTINEVQQDCNDKEQPQSSQHGHQLLVLGSATNNEDHRIYPLQNQHSLKQNQHYSHHQQDFNHRAPNHNYGPQQYQQYYSNRPQDLIHQPHQAPNHNYGNAKVQQTYVNYNDNNQYRDHEENDELAYKKADNTHYKFEYAVNDNKSGDVKRHREERKGDVVKGEYSLLEQDGNVRTVKYYADWKTGFHAQIYNSRKSALG